jgi:uncharacterized membrane protein
MNRIDLKEKSKQDLGGELFNKPWLSAVGVLLVYGMLTGSFSVNINTGTINGGTGGNVTVDEQFLAAFLIAMLVAVAIGIVVSILLLPLYYGLVKYFVKISRGEEAKFRYLFSGYKENWKQNAMTQFMSGLYVFFWSLLFIIPGIIKHYSYAMTYYIRNDHPEYTATEAITKSREMMKGYKGKLFLLELSFIGWAIIGVLCCGIGVLWVYPYMEMSKAHFYQELKNKLEPIVPPLSEDAPTEETTEA